MRRDFSAGGIVIKKLNNSVQILLIQSPGKDRKNEYWGFPKGHLEEGETSQQAAEREVLEETGVTAEVVEKIDDTKYFFVWEGERVFKTVSFFLMRYLNGEVKFQSSELIGADWFDIETAMEKLTFKNDKKLLEKAIGLIQLS